MSRYDWMGSALCAQTDPDLFHIEGHGSRYTEARKICAACPVSGACSEFAQAIEGEVEHPYRHGLWGGQAPRRRAESNSKPKRRETHAKILRLHERGGLTRDEIAEQAGVDSRTVSRVVKSHREAA